MNKVIMSGRLTRDPELKNTQTGTSSTRFTLAVERTTARDENGNRVSDFINCVAFGTSADFITKYLKKGDKMLIEGGIRTGKYTNQQGVEVFTTDIYVERVESLTSRNDAQQQAAPNMQQPMQQYNQPQVLPQVQQPTFNVDDDINLPF